MKLKVAAVVLLVALCLVSSFADIVAADSGEDAGSDNTIFENPRDVPDNGDPGANPCGGGDDVGGGTPG